MPDVVLAEFGVLYASGKSISPREVIRVHEKIF